MSAELVTIRGTFEYKKLLDDCAAIQNGLAQNAHEMLVRAYWQLGLRITEYEATGEITREYRNATITCLAADIHINASNLYRAIQLATQFPDQQAYGDLVQSCIDTKHTFSWTYVRNNVLPDPTKRSELYGGKVAVVDQMMMEAETLALKAERLNEMLKEQDIDLDKRREIEGVVAQVAEVIDESKRILLPDFSPTSNSSENYLDYIRSLECVICGKSPSDPHHLDTAGVAMKGSDYITVPLCREHHDELHSQGKATFQQLHGVDFYKEVVKFLVAWLEVQVDKKTMARDMQAGN